MATAQRQAAGDEWRLGELSDHEHIEAQRVPDAPQDLSRARLTRPLHVVTVEHAAWAIIFVWAVATRLIALGVRPLASSEAAHALFAYDLAFKTREAAAAGYLAEWSGWVHLAQAAIFAVGGSGEFSARLLFALAGLLIIAMAFEMRHYVGRAGGLAFGAMLAASPSVTYFSRASAMETVAMAFALVTLASFMAMTFAPSMAKAVAMGICGGLMAAADPAGLITGAIFIIALVVIGLLQAIFTRDRYLRVRVWMDRYAAMLVAVIVAVTVTFGLSEFVVFGASAVSRTAAMAESLWHGATLSEYRGALGYYAAGIALYEFLILITAATGLAIIAAWRVRTRFAAFATVWTLMSFGVFLLTPYRRPGCVLAMIIPAAMAGAILIDHVHHTSWWAASRIAIGALAALTVYVQVMTIFVHCGPDASEAPWARHANLYWRDGATTIQAGDEFGEIRRQAAQGDQSVHIDRPWTPSLRWFMRDFVAVPNPGAATVDISGGATNPDTSASRHYAFDYEEGWDADLRSATFGQGLKYIFTEEPWSRIRSRSISVIVTPQRPGAPTLILPPK